MPENSRGRWGLGVWEVVGGASSGGIVVRVGRDTASEMVAERLATGSLVSATELEDGRLCFERLSGSGPAYGWASLRLQAGRLLLAPVAGLWEVVGGGDRGGIVVREGPEVGSAQAEARLETGALVRELELVGSRLRYRCIVGQGPEEGWVSVHLQGGKDLLTRVVAPGAESEIIGLPRVPLPVQAARGRILALHGAPGNSNIMRFQVKLLQKVAGPDFEWSFLDGPCAWEPLEGATALNLCERTLIEKSLAKGLPFTQWYSHPLPELAGPSEALADSAPQAGALSFENVIYLNVEDGMGFLDEYIAREGPFDVLVAFSQSGTLAAMYLDKLRTEAKPNPWRLSLLFCGSMIDDLRLQLQEPLALPTIYVAGGDKDDWCAHGLRCLPKMYTDLKVLTHEDGNIIGFQRPDWDLIFVGLPR